MALIKTLLVDDHDIVRQGLKNILAADKQIRLVGEAESGQTAIKLVRQEQPEVVVLDLKLPDMDGNQVTEKLLRINPDIKILILTSVTNELYPAKLLEAGVFGYITKEASIYDIVHAIHQVHHGQRYLSSDIASKLAFAKTGANKAGSPFDKLSQKEMAVMLMVVRGSSNEDMAQRLNISPKTVGTHRYRIFDKLNVANNVEMTLLAIKHGVIEIDS